MTYLCSLMSGASTEDLKSRNLNHLRIHIFLCLVVDAGYQLGTSVPLHVGSMWSSFICKSGLPHSIMDEFKGQKIPKRE